MIYPLRRRTPQRIITRPSPPQPLLEALRHRNRPPLKIIRGKPVEDDDTDADREVAEAAGLLELFGGLDYAGDHVVESW